MGRGQFQSGVNGLRQFHFKFIHRVVVTKKELFQFNIKPDSNCIYCGESDSIDHTFIECQFTKSFTQGVSQWFNVNNSSNFILNAEDVLFGLSSASGTLSKLLNYTLLFLRYYIYKSVSSKITHHHYGSLILSIK